MPQYVYLGKFPQGLVDDKLAFNLDNLAFPFLYNFFVWRERVLRKRGTTTVGRLTNQIEIGATKTDPWVYVGPNLVADDVNVITSLNLGIHSMLKPGTINITVGANTYTDAAEDGVLTGNPAGSGTVNYASGEITISGGGAGQVTGFFSYFPGLVVLGLTSYTVTPSANLYPELIAFDEKYAYKCEQGFNDTNFYSISYYKSSQAQVTWNGGDYQQFWSTNYQNAYWCTNDDPGLHVLSGTTTPATATSFTFNLMLSGAPYTNLYVDDVLWFNEWSSSDDINQKTGIITDASGAAAGNYVVTFSQSVTIGAASGYVFLLTNQIPNNGGIKFIDQDPTSGTGLPDISGFGWVNFAPCLTASGAVSIDGSTPAVYYVAGCNMMLSFKDRLVLFNVVLQTASGFQILLQDGIVFSWNGTPYYTVNASGQATLTPSGETASPLSWYVDQSGLGGWASAAIQSPIKTANFNQDAIIVGFGGDGRKTRLVYTGNDFLPFAFYNINTEMPSQATFSGVSLDRGVLDIGPNGITITNQNSAQRIDEQIPYEVFSIKNASNGYDRINAARDFENELIYFSYPLQPSEWKFPTQTFCWNYRNQSWSIFYENFTAHGPYRPSTRFTWATCPFASWDVWNEPWNSVTSGQLVPIVIAGNPQGFVLALYQGTNESPSGSIKDITEVSGNCTITSYNHCVTQSNPVLGSGDYLYIEDVLGLKTSVITMISKANPCVITTTPSSAYTVGKLVTIADVVGMTELNGNTYEVVAADTTTVTIDVDSTDFNDYDSAGTVTSAFNNQVVQVLKTDSMDTDTFEIDFQYPEFESSGYLGKGTFERMSLPKLQTKQFNFYWEAGRQIRLGVQKYLLDTTDNGQVTLQIYLNQDNINPWNNPDIAEHPSALIYSNIIHTNPAVTATGQSPFNQNLLNPIGFNAQQILHRVNQSLNGSSFQLGITLSDSQMRNYQTARDEIVLHGIHLTVDAGPYLA